MKEAVRAAGRYARSWLGAIRHTTVLAGAGLGILLVAVLTLAGAVGLDPLPGLHTGEREPSPRGSALSATQPEVRRSLLGPDDLAPGYTPVPGVVPTAEGSSALPPPAAGAVPPAAVTASPELLPGLPLEGLPLDDGLLGEDVFGEDRAEDGTGQEDGPAGGGPADGAGEAPSARPSASPGGTPGTPEHGAGPARPAGARCRWLLHAPWALATAGREPVAPPQAADHLDPDRGVRLRQALGGFAADGAARGLARIREVAAACPRFRAGRGGPRRGWHGAGRVTATVAPGPAYPAGAGPAPDEAFAVRLTLTTRDGRGWTGYLAADRVGPVLSVLWHAGPSGVIGTAEADATRRAAVAKAWPLARRLSGPAGP